MVKELQHFVPSHSSSGRQSVFYSFVSFTRKKAAGLVRHNESDH